MQKKILIISLLILPRVLMASLDTSTPQYDFSGEEAVACLIRNGDCRDCDLSNQDLRDVMATVNSKYRKRCMYTDLSGANLSNANLSGVDLSRATMRDTNLTGANLAGANMSDAIMTDANLTDADLTNANLSYAIMTDADLSGANLTNTNLSDATLYNVNMTGANITRVQPYSGARSTGARYLYEHLEPYMAIK